MSEVTEEQVRQLYRALRSSENEVLLQNILFELKFLSPCENEGDMALNNYAKRLLMMVYADDEGQIDCGLFNRILRRMVKRYRLKENKT